MVKTGFLYDMGSGNWVNSIHNVHLTTGSICYILPPMCGAQTQV